ncbi:hypothetical protein M0813_18071 [Anaeramoeba flamelloides]|uniref:PAS domain-containing protein n=1 Tax=Anaeramoeba flamelloides TaxID=1746091 RepID=A0ABQ8YTM0_9EUKA|nr:hypothetical protein M0813_18071 [Anaeramoeba flamelloides]
MGNSENSHKIKKRHKKKYFQKLENSGLPICVLDQKGQLIFTSKKTYELYGYNPEKLTGNENILALNKPFQKHSQLSAEKAMAKGTKELMESKDGTHTVEWEAVTATGEDLDLWCRGVCVMIGNQPHVQMLHQLRSSDSNNSNNKEPSSVDESILKVQIEDNTSFSPNSEFSSLDKSSGKESKSKNSRRKHNYSSEDNGIDNLIELDEIIDIVDQIKNKIRSFKEPEQEKIMIEKLNLLIETVESQKNESHTQTMRIIKKTKEHNIKNKKRYKELEKQFEIRTNLLSKHEMKINKLELENKLLKEQSQKLVNLISTFNKSSRKIIKQSMSANEQLKK